MMLPPGGGCVLALSRRLGVVVATDVWQIARGQDDPPSQAQQVAEQRPSDVLLDL